MTTAPPPPPGRPAPATPVPAGAGLPTGSAHLPPRRRRRATVQTRVALPLMLLAFVAGTVPFVFLRWISGDTDAAAIPAGVCTAVDVATGRTGTQAYVADSGDHRKRATCTLDGFGEDPDVEVQVFTLGDVDSSTADLQSEYLGSVFCGAAAVGDAQPTPSPEITELGGVYQCAVSRDVDDAVTVAVAGQDATDSGIFCSVVYRREGIDVPTAYAEARTVVQQVLARF